MKTVATPRLTRLARQLRSLTTGLLLLPLLAAGWVQAAAPDRLTLLVPDGADLNSWEVKVWTDTAAEEGLRIEVLRDSAFLAMGSASAASVGGLIIPDSAHIKASDALVAAIKQYAYLGGKLMLVYDAGVLSDTGFYPLSGNSRFGDMVGVEYALWNNGAGANTMVGFGQVVGTQARLDALGLPPGKYLPYAAPATLATATATTAFVPTSQFDPGGSLAMRASIQQRAAQLIDESSANTRNSRTLPILSWRQLLGIGVQPLSPLRYERRNPNATTARDQHASDKLALASDRVAAKGIAGQSTALEMAPILVAAPVASPSSTQSSTSRTFSATQSTPTIALSAVALTAAEASLNAISGYGYGPIGYYHYVTTGAFPGAVQLSSPEHGLVAGTRNYGSGQVLYVNLPLGYFKAIGTDGQPLHGYLSQFAREQVGIPKMSTQPNGRGGLIYNWHVDDGDDLTSDTKFLLDSTSVLSGSGPFSIQFTAGPDVVNFGDGQGMNLAKSGTSKALVRRLRDLSVKHELGSHGGWIHDYWGTYANEANSPDLTSLLTQNFAAIENTTGKRIREYSSPQGNTPTWAVRWLEARGVVGFYSAGDGGAGAIRPWRNGQRLTTNMWAFPVTPLGRYATFEEFEEFGVSDATALQWWLDLQSFAVNQRTTRLFYNHPPGARGHLSVVQPFLTRANSLQAAGKFKFYTMAELADFSQRRLATSWTKTTTAGVASFNASNASSLSQMTWLLPITRYNTPAVTAGSATVSSDAQNWVVTATSGAVLRFIAQEK